VKTISRSRLARIVAVMLLLVVAGAGTCQPPPASSGAETTDGTAGIGLSDQEVAMAIRQVHPLMSDIPPIPIPDALVDRQDEHAQRALDILNTVNGFASSDFWSISSAKLTAVRKSSGGWVEDATNPWIVTYTKKDGDLTTTVTHMLGVPGNWLWWVTWDGCDGKHLYRDFMVDWWMLGKDGKLMKHDAFQCLDAPPCSAESGCHESTPLYTWVFEVLDEATLYTLWDEVRLVTRAYTTISYAYSNRFNAFLPFTQEVCTSYPDGRLVFESFKRRLSDDILYRWYEGRWPADYRYCWTMYREDQTVLDCGGDMNCPQCSIP